MANQVPARNGGTLTRCNKGETMNPNGRPRKIVSCIMKDLQDHGCEPVKAGQVVNIFEMMLNMTMREIKSIEANENNPYFLRVIAKAMLSQRGFEIIEKMLDRAHGKPKQVNMITDSYGSGLFKRTIVVASEEVKKDLESLGVNEDSIIIPVTGMKIV